MSKSKLQGVFPPVVTCFTEDGAIYEKGIANVVNFLLERGVHGLFITGSYGSAPLMNEEERKRVAEAYFREVNDRVPVIVHVGSAGTQNTISLAKHAEGLGAAAVAAVTPFYYSGFAYKEQEILTHYEKLVKAVNIPVYLYNNPKTTGYNVSPELLAKLARLGVAGIKDSSGDLMAFADYMNMVSPINSDFNFMTGTVGLILPSYVFGSRSCVAGTANVLPELVCELWSAMEQNDMEKAVRLQKTVIAIRKIQGITGFRPAGCYSILRMRGVDAGCSRDPWRRLTPEEEAKVETGLKNLGVL